MERYGGMIFAPWFDRPLSVAGRLIIKDPFTGKLEIRLVNVDRDLVMIPNLAIHMNREVNNGYKYNAQKDMLPLYGMNTAKGTFMQTVAKAAGVSADDILGHDLFLYNRERASIWGASGEFISAPQLDDLQCAFSSMKGFLSSEKTIFLLYIVYLITKRWEAAQNKAQLHIFTRYPAAHPRSAWL